MKYRKFKLSNGEIIETPYYMWNKDGYLFNNNSKRIEALDGDSVNIDEGFGRIITGIVDGHSEFQCVGLKDFKGGGVVMGAEPARNGAMQITHNTSIIDEIDPPTVYISGPMTGLSEEEYKQNFQNAYDELRKKGFQPCNPSINSINDSDMTYNDILMFDLDTLSNYDAIYMLRGYEKSKGAMAELYVANALDSEIMYEEGAEIFPLWGER